MSSTNKTTHYDLSQYVAADKPTYLVDYNADMSAIDTAIYNADSLAQTNESAIGNLTLLDTTIKTDLVSAVNEVEGEVDTLGTTVAGHTTSIATNTSAIGTLANLDTQIKTDLVSAINETRNSFDISVKKTYQNTSDVTAVNANVTGINVKVATSSNGDIGKVYGNITFKANFSVASFSLTNSGIRTDASYGIDNIVMLSDSNGTVRAIKSLTVNDNELYMLFDNLTNGSNYTVSIIPVIIYFKDFGDIPSPQQ